VDQNLGCADFVEALSASWDGELDPSEETGLAAHLEQCVHCQNFVEQLSVLTRRVRLREVTAVPDVATVVLGRARPARLGRGGWMRPALVWVAVVMGVQSLGPLFTSTVGGVDTHAARHLGAFALALAVGLAYVAWRPHRAFGLLPFALALVGTTIGAAILDVWTKRSTALAESVHVTELVGVAILWMIAGSPGWDRVREFMASVRLRPART
jgi:anti-sigma factor RsiW